MTNCDKSVILETLNKGGYALLLGKPEGRKPLETPRFTWGDNIKEDIEISTK
jgi:hypothetical protein